MYDCLSDIFYLLYLAFPVIDSFFFFILYLVFEYRCVRVFFPVNYKLVLMSKSKV